MIKLLYLEIWFKPFKGICCQGSHENVREFYNYNKMFPIVSSLI